MIDYKKKTKLSKFWNKSNRVLKYRPLTVCNAAPVDYPLAIAVESVFVAGERRPAVNAVPRQAVVPAIVLDPSGSTAKKYLNKKTNKKHYINFKYFGWLCEKKSCGCD